MPNPTTHLDTTTLPAGVQRNWTFEASTEPRRPVSFYERRQAVLALRPSPKFQVIRSVQPHPRWFVYFVYLPDGQLQESHRFTLSRLRTDGHKLLLVCASPSPRLVPHELETACDALIWKDLSGYDFSAYKLALMAIARHAPGAQVFVMNDSVFGPLLDIGPFVQNAPWDLTGFTASSQLENHVQSYAFVMRDVTPARLRMLRSVFLPWIAFNRPFDVIEYQETRLAKVAARCMSVGAYWYADHHLVEDPTLSCPLNMLQSGFPFIKKSLLGKHARFADQDLIRQALTQHGHPSP